MYKFWKHNNEWRYKHKLDAAGKPIDTFALERVLGVVGGPEVIVAREQPNGKKLNIVIKNGFIDSVIHKEVPDLSGVNTFLREGASFAIFEFVEKDEFYAEEIPL